MSLGIPYGPLSKTMRLIARNAQRVATLRDKDIGACCFRFPLQPAQGSAGRDPWLVFDVFNNQHRTPLA
jgi:hypothetical protein